MSNWKQTIKPFKNYLQAIYPASSKSWYQKARKSDFNWVGDKPYPKGRSPALTSAIEESFRKVDVLDALKTIQPGKPIRATIAFYSELKADSSNGNGEFEVSFVVPFEFQSQLRLLMKMDKKYSTRVSIMKSDWESVGRPAGHMYKRYYGYLISVMDMLKKLIPRNQYEYLVDQYLSQSYWYVFPGKSYARIITNKLGAGPAFNAAGGNCVLKAIRLALGPSITEDQKNQLAKLNTEYVQGVWPSDYEKISKKLRVRLNITFAPSSDAAKKWAKDGAKTDDQLHMLCGYTKDPQIDLHHWSSHCSSMKKVIDGEFEYANSLQMEKLLIAHPEQLYQTTECSITLRREEDQYITYQYSRDGGVALDLGKTSAQSQLYALYSSQIVPYAYTDPNRPMYDSFAKHGIHYSNGQEKKTDIDLDVRAAYSNYDKFPLYNGLPRDITYWVNEPTLEQIRSNIGFVLCKFTCPIRQKQLQKWILSDYYLFLLENDFVHETIQAAFAHSKFDLDKTGMVQSDPEGEPIHKRVFHKIVGASTATMSKKTFITNDQFEINDNACGMIRLPNCVEMDDELGYYLQNHRQITVAVPSEANRISHVAAAIQDYVSLEITRMYLSVMKSNPDAKLNTALVDGIRFSRTGIDMSKIDLGDNWVVKKCMKANTSPQSDWETPSARAIVATNDFIPVNWPITLIPKYQHMLSADFCKMVQEGYIHSLQGFAGSGKSYTMRKLLEQFNAVVLTPTHSTREDMASYAIREHLDDEQLRKIPVKTYQSVIQGGTAIGAYQVIIVDEAGMILVEDINRLIEIAGRKLIILVGDPAQHKAIAMTGGSLEAKYIQFKDHIENDAKLKEIYDNGSDWERNNMLQKLRYDCEAPKGEPMSDDEITAKRERKTMIGSFIREIIKTKLSNATGIFETFTASTILTEIKRTDNSADGQVLNALCNDVRTNGMAAVQRFVRENPANRGDIDCITKDSIVISYRNSSLNVNTTEFTTTNEKGDTVVYKDIEDIGYREYINRLVCPGRVSALINKADDPDSQHLRMVFPDTKVEIINRHTFVYNGNTIYNGARGTIFNDMMVFESLPDVEIPYDGHQIDTAYAYTSYIAQGRTIADKRIVIDCSCVSRSMLYVALSRATTIGQIRFINIPGADDVIKDLDSWYGDDSKFEVADNDFKLPVKITNNDKVLINKQNKLWQFDYTNIDWDSVHSNFIQLISQSYFGATAEQKRINERAHMPRLRRAAIALALGDVDHGIDTTPFNVKGSPNAKKPVAKVDLKTWGYDSAIKPSTYGINYSEMTYNTKRPAKVSITDAYGNSEVEEYSFCCRVERDGYQRVFLWFLNNGDLIKFNEGITKACKVECHEVITDRQIRYFIDLDYKCSKSQIKNQFGDLNVANDKIGRFLSGRLIEAATEMGWDTSEYRCSVSQRSRYTGDVAKVSLHLYTNLICSFNEARQLTEALKRIALDKVETSEKHEHMYDNIDELLEGIDTQPYGPNKSLAMVGGSKNGLKSKSMIRGLKTISPVDGISRVVYQDAESDDEDSDSDDEDDVKPIKKQSVSLAIAVSKLDDCKYFNAHQMDKSLSSTFPDGNGGLVRRVMGGHCKCCGGHHDNDNTLRVWIYKGRAFAQCSRGGKSTCFA